MGFAIVCALPFLLSGLWVGLLATGVAYGVLFLSYTLVTGEGGMVWLCVPTFAAVGGLMTGQLAELHGWPVLAAVVVGGLVAVPFGVILGALTIRLGNLYVALVTLTFGLLMENLVFSQARFLNQGLGVTVPMPGFATTPRAFTYLALAIFAVIAVFIVNLRRSTHGLGALRGAMERAGVQDHRAERPAHEGRDGRAGRLHRRYRRRPARHLARGGPAGQLRRPSSAWPGWPWWCCAASGRTSPPSWPDS